MLPKCHAYILEHRMYTRETFTRAANASRDFIGVIGRNACGSPRYPSASPSLRYSSDNETAINNRGGDSL